MSLYFLINSQAELQLGLPWLKHFSHSGHGAIQLVVVGSERQALHKIASSEAKKHDEVESVLQVDADPQEVKRWIRKTGCPTLVMVSDHDNDEFEQAIFEVSSSPTLWLRPKQKVPHSGQQIFSLDGEHQDSAVSVAKRYFGVPAELTLLDASDLSPDDPPQVNDDKNQDAMQQARVIDVERQRCDEGDLIVVTLASDYRTDASYTVALRLINESSVASVMLYHPGDTLTKSFSRTLRGWMERIADPMEREHRVELSNSLREGSQPSLEFLGLISASSMLAAFGLLQDSAAVIIGAMLIAPLMTPILGAGLSLSHGNRKLFYTSLKAIGLGFAGALSASFLFGLLVRITQGPSETGEMLARCNPSPLDFCVGFVGGVAASYARTRTHLSGALAGAAIAAALVPPIATAGLQLAFGHFSIPGIRTPILGPLLLVSINVITIMVGSSLVLYLRGMHDDSDDQPNRWGLRMFALLTIMTCLVLAAVI